MLFIDNFSSANSAVGGTPGWPAFVVDAMLGSGWLPD